MISPATADALNRIASRAQDVLRAYRAGGFAVAGDVNINPRGPERASDPLSIAAPPGAYLVTQSADGARSFTRDGGLRIVNGTLSTSNGAAVLGYPSGAARGAPPIALQLPARDVALGRCADVRIEGDGTLAYTRSAVDPRTGERHGERIALGRIALARFPAGTQPVRLDDTHVAAPSGIPPHLGMPGDGIFPAVATFARDIGSVDIDTSLQKLAEAYQSFSALHAATTAHGKAERTVMDLLK